MTDPFEITRKIGELIRKKHMDDSFFALIHYSQNEEENIWIASTDDQKIKSLCKQHLVDAIQCPKCYPCRTIENLHIYSATWKEGIIVLAGTGFEPQGILDESIKQLGIGVE